MSESGSTDVRIALRILFRFVLKSFGFSSQTKRLRLLAADIKSSKDRLNGILALKKILAPDDVIWVQNFIHTMHIFEAEVLSYLQDWDQLLKTVAVRPRLSILRKYIVNWSSVKRM
jgi:hypothetical protein